MHDDVSERTTSAFEALVGHFPSVQLEAKNHFGYVQGPPVDSKLRLEKVRADGKGLGLTSCKSEYSLGKKLATTPTRNTFVK